ncbi:MAG TPA: hypothetical protein VGC65_12170 [Bacteroidia bacterium]|jgi:hypothetical protein
MKKITLKLGERSVSNKIGFAGTIYLQMIGNAYFPSSGPLLAQLQAAAAALSQAADKAKVGGKAETEDMRAKEYALDLLFNKVGDDVENIANSNPDYAEAIITSAGLDVKRQGAINIPILSVKRGKEANSVVVRRKALSRVVYKWEYAQDPFTSDGWTAAGETTNATVEIEDLEPLKRYWFRVATIKGSTLSEFTDPVTFVIS